MSVEGQSRRVEHVVGTSASPPNPDVLRRRSEPTRRATSGLMRCKRPNRVGLTTLNRKGRVARCLSQLRSGLLARPR
jgi:hypothetical protein